MIKLEFRLLSCSTRNWHSKHLPYTGCSSNPVVVECTPLHCKKLQL